MTRSFGSRAQKLWCSLTHSALMCEVCVASCAPGVLVACVVSLGAPCAAQEVDVPTPPPDAGQGRGSVFAPSAWVVTDVPLQKQIDLKLYGFYIGELNTPVTQVDVPIRTTKFLTLTPSYMYYSVPASGLNKLPPQPGSFTDSYNEHQFRIDGTVPFAIRKLEISVRNMYVRRFRPFPARRYQPLSWASCDRLSPRRLTTASGSRSPHTKPSMSRRAGGTETDSGPESTLPVKARCFPSAFLHVGEQYRQ